MSGRLEKKMAGGEERTGPVKRDWTRINRKEDIFNQDWESQEEAEECACRDMEKPIEQLLSDIHEGYAKRSADLKKLEKSEFADPVALTLKILMRMGSMMAVVAKSNERLQWVLIGLTIAIFLLTVVLVILTIRL
jgi:DNA-binding TFAR19-related protein (PDSD5 family)